MNKTNSKTMTVVVLGFISLLYLLNPGLGIFEFLPDQIPFVGHLDETLATTILISAFAYFGIDIRAFVPKKNTKSFQSKK